MSETVTLDVPEPLATSARAVAARTHRRIEDVLLDWLGQLAAEMPLEALPDEQILALKELQMTDAQQEELSDLLGDQREGVLDAAGRARLVEAMGAYRRGLVLKARATRLAVERGLAPPLSCRSIQRDLRRC
jgi:hypothetical protein